MNDKQPTNSHPIRFTPVSRSQGITGAERTLQKMCERSFLSLWSYAGIYRDQFGKGAGKAGGGRGDGKEVCDLLVVFQNHILIFSDKDCAFPDSGNLEVDWGRWYRKAVQKSAEQVYGAERWIKQHPNRLFLDRECLQRFPVEMPPLDQAIFHRIVVAHDGARRCREHFGGSGSLIIQPRLVGVDPTKPFVIGQVDPTRGYVHVFDDTSLDIAMQTLDTVSDFVAYLQKKEKFVLSGRLGGAAGEEELLAHYLKRLNIRQEHDFFVPDGIGELHIGEGEWAKFQTNPQRLAQINANRVSYFWDKLIETFCAHIYAGTSYTMSHPSVSDQERVFRLAARETRTRRRLLSTSYFEIVDKTPRDRRGIRIVQPSNPGDPYYAFLLLPYLTGIPEAEYREVRAKLLEAVCQVVKVMYPDAEDVVGIASETGMNQHCSHDFVYFDARNWTDDEENEARALQRDLDILTNIQEFRGRVSEYPSASSVQRRIPANYACPCGSGRKYKRCCGKNE